MLLVALGVLAKNQVASRNRNSGIFNLKSNGAPNHFLDPSIIKSIFYLFTPNSFGLLLSLTLLAALGAYSDHIIFIKNYQVLIAISMGEIEQLLFKMFLVSPSCPFPIKTDLNII